MLIWLRRLSVQFIYLHFKYQRIRASDYVNDMQVDYLHPNIQNWESTIKANASLSNHNARLKARYVITR